jgi:hypothetical protein
MPIKHKILHFKRLLLIQFVRTQQNEAIQHSGALALAALCIMKMGGKQTFAASLA